VYFSGCGLNGWDMDDEKRSHERYHGRTPGGEAADGDDAGGYAIGRIARQMFFLVLACSLLAFMPSGTPLLVALGVPLGLSAAFALATYGILRLTARVFCRRRRKGEGL